MDKDDFRNMYRTAAIVLAKMVKPPIDPNALIIVSDLGSPTVREVLDWAATDEGRETLKPDVRNNLLEFAARLI